ncbi:MAG TPA: glycosyltransferase family 4 protein [Candidatus Binatia bacterium]
MTGKVLSPLKILHIDPERNWGGGEAQVLGLLFYLAERGHRAHLLAHPDGRLFQQSQARRIRTMPLIARNDFDLRPVSRLRRLIRDERYDIVHLHTKRAHALSLWLSRGSVTPKYVVTRRMDYPEANSWYTRYLYNRKVDGVVAISRKISTLLIEAGVERERIRLIHSGIDPRPFEAAVNLRDVHPEGVKVGMAAVLEERKGHRFLLEAARRLKVQGCQIQYCIAGEGSLKKSLEEIVTRLGLKDEVQFLGFVSDIPAFLSQVDILVLPSLFEGLGVSVLEAMAAGKAVIASRVGGLVELVHDTVTGLLVAPRDVEGLANAIAKLAGDRTLRREMGRKGKERLQANFTVEQMAKQNEDYYYRLLEQSRRMSHGAGSHLISE